MDTDPDLRTYTAEEAAALDRAAIETLGVDRKQLMEVAGLRAAETADAMCQGDEGRAPIVVMAGSGGNGGDALACAKWLLLWGHDVSVVLSHPINAMQEIALDQLHIFERIGGRVASAAPAVLPALIIDGLLGIAGTGDPRGETAILIDWANGTGAPILALDVPSGLDATTGKATTPCIRAACTTVFGVMKQGLTAPGAEQFTGTLELIDIGLPTDRLEKGLRTTRRPATKVR